MLLRLLLISYVWKIGMIVVVMMLIIGVLKCGCRYVK